jgi:hypothetical protein
MELTTVTVAIDLITKASKALDWVRERAKTSNDAALKESISKLYDDFLDLKAIILRLTEETWNIRREHDLDEPLEDWHWLYKMLDKSIVQHNVISPYDIATIRDRYLSRHTK